MSKTLYAIIHEYDVDGGYGDAIGNEQTLGIFSDKCKAEEYYEKYHNPKYVGGFLEHSLRIDEIEIDALDINESPWGEDDNANEVDFKFFKSIARYGNENWKGNFSEDELNEYAWDYLNEFEASRDDEPTETIKELYNLLIEDGSVVCLDWAYTLATELGLIDMDFMDYMEIDSELIKKFLSK